MSTIINCHRNRGGSDVLSENNFKVAAVKQKKVSTITNSLGGNDGEKPSAFLWAAGWQLLHLRALCSPCCGRLPLPRPLFSQSPPVVHLGIACTATEEPPGLDESHLEDGEDVLFPENASKSSFEISFFFVSTQVS